MNIFLIILNSIIYISFAVVLVTTITTRKKWGKNLIEGKVKIKNKGEMIWWAVLSLFTLSFVMNLIENKALRPKDFNAIALIIIFCSFIYLGRNYFKVTEKGILYATGGTDWEHISYYEWNENTLKLKVTTSCNELFWECKMNSNQKETMDKLLKTYSVHEKCN